MSLAINSSGFIVGLVAAGFAAVFMLSDGGSRTTRALSLCLAAIAASVFAGTSALAEASLLMSMSGNLGEALATLAGVEWGRRIGETAARGRLQRGTNGLFRAAQILVLVYAALMVGYQLIWPELALVRERGVIAVRGVEFAVFAPVLGTAMLLATIALLILLLMPIDSAEKARLRGLLGAGPFLLMGLVVGEELIPMTLTLGLLVLLLGSVRYLMVHSQRGDFMRRFLPPEVAHEVQRGGLEPLLKRERRRISVLACDLRGFTAYARDRDSDEVAGLLERYYAVVGSVSAAHGGTVKDHAGDGVLILVGAPLPLADHAARAEQLARELRARVLALLREAGEGLGLGIGIATGSITVGAIRGAGRLEYVAVGTAVNLAARLCDRAEHGEILMDLHTVQALAGAERTALQARAPETLKGFDEPVPVYALAF